MKSYAQWLVFTDASMGHNHKVFTVLPTCSSPENKPSAYGDSSFNRNVLLSVYICLLQNPTHRTFNNVRSVSLNITLFYIREVVAEKVPV